MGLDENGYILFLSRLVPEKGCHYLINAYKRIGTSKKLVIAGGCNHPDGYYNSLKMQAGESIIFTGFVRGQLLEELFSNAYCFVQPSEMEGVPHSVLQALSFGKAVLASDIPGNLEALGDCGFKFRRGDESDLREKLEYLLSNPQVVAAESEKAIRHVQQNYNWDDIADEMEQVFFSVMGS
jgi:glycosyltransferase involved in cell wall biosynthesis